MADVLCPLCGTENPSGTSSCLNCGNQLKQSTTPLPPLKPGEIPTKKSTSDLENTLPTWLRDARKASQDESPSSMESTQPSSLFGTEDGVPDFLKQAASSTQAPGAPVDFLAGLAQSSSDDDEEIPDWMSSLRPAAADTPLTPPAAPEPEPDNSDWLSALNPEPAKPAESQPVSDAWGFSADSAIDFQGGDDAPVPIDDTVPDWLTALKAQDAANASQSSATAFDSSNAADDWLKSSAPEPASPFSDDASASVGTPDWLADLGGGPADVPAQPASSDWLSSFSSEPAAETPAASSGTPDWLADLGGDAPVQPAASDDSSDWLSSLSAESLPEPPADSAGTSDWMADFGGAAEAPVSEQPVSTGDTPDWLADLGGDAPVQPAASDDSSDWLSSFSSEPAVEAPVASGGTSDWLADLGGDTPAQPASSGGDSIDWLSDLGGTAEVPASEQPIAAGDTPDWLADLGGDAPAQSASSDDSSDWLSSFSTESTPETPADSVGTSDWMADFGDTAEAPVAEQPVASGDTPDWLADLGGDAPAQPAASDDSSDWLSSFSTESTPETPADSAGMTDWMADFGDTAEAPVAEQPVASGDTPDWLADLGGDAPAQPASSGGDSIDWLSDLGGASEAPVFEQPVASGDTPDWLADLGGDAPAQPASSGGDSIDWLSDLGGGTSESPAFEQPVASGDAPDWLSDISSEPASADSDAFAAGTGMAFSVDAAASETADDTSDWLSGLSSDAGQPEDTGDMPGWLSADANVESAPAEPLAKPFDTGALSATGLTTDDASDMPDWLSGLSSEPASLPESVPAADMFSAVGESAPAPDWLSGTDEGGFSQGLSFDDTATQPEGGELFETSASSFELPSSADVGELPGDSSSSQDIDSLLSMDMPDWLSGFAPAASAVASATDESAEPDLNQADLPSWVQAMRPVESVIDQSDVEEGDVVVETAGPLAGMKNILPVAGDGLAISKPKPYSIKLQADDIQQSQSALLEELLLAENTPQPLRAQKRIASNNMLRWIVAAVLLLAILVPSVLGGGLLTAPNSIGVETLGTIEVISSLPDAAPVLVVVDYQPAFAGEMEAAASPILDHLMLRGAHLAFVSSQPTGPLMAERLVAHQNAAHSYAQNVDYIELGYISGGAAGIQVFASDPLAALGTHTQRGNLWMTAPLTSVSRFDDFSAVVVLVDNPDDGRIWVEQAQPRLGDKPMLMVISAQAEPMLRPYYDAGQVQGMVTGLVGGAAYETAIQRPGQAQQFWDAYGFSLFASEIMIVVSAVWMLVKDRLSRRAEAELDLDEDEA